MPRYYITHPTRVIIPATMPHGTTDRAFADLVAASIPGASVGVR